jgi:hypothetical protein
MPHRHRIKVATGAAAFRACLERAMLKIKSKTLEQEPVYDLRARCELRFDTQLIGEAPR